MASTPAACVAAVDEALWKAHSVEELLRAFSADKQGAVHDALIALSSAYRSVDGLAQGLPATQVEAPARLLAWIDAGKDPDEFVKLLFSETLALHQARACAAWLAAAACTRAPS